MKKDYEAKFTHVNSRLWAMKPDLAKHFDISPNHARKIQGIRVIYPAGRRPEVQIMTVGWVNYGAASRIRADWETPYEGKHDTSASVIKRFQRLKALEDAYKILDLRQRYSEICSTNGK